MANLERTPAYKRLQPGDPWTFVNCTPEQMANAKELGVGGRTCEWFNTGEPGCIFEVVRIHDALNAVETKYLGFEVKPGTKGTPDEAVAND